MATYSTLKKGSKGNDVLELQKLLNQNGYSLDTDGIYGDNTASAVRDYQNKKGLSVDGIVGNQTWTSLLGAGDGASVDADAYSSAADMLRGFETSGSRPSYSESSELQSIRDQLAAFEEQKPADYQSRYQQQIDDLLGKIMNREAFQYNFDADPLYQQYKDKYTQQGKLAMQDTMAQAAALTGGYGNSFAQQVGQQTYNANMQALNDVIPELYNQAYNMYRDQGNDMRDNLGLYMDMDTVDYNRYRDDVGDYYTELQYLYNKASDMSQQEYNRYLNDADAWEADRNYWLNKVAMEQDQANWQAEYDLAASKATGGTGSGDGGAEPTKQLNPETDNTVVVYGYNGKGTKGGKGMTQEEFAREVDRGNVVMHDNGDGTYEWRVTKEFANK